MEEAGKAVADVKRSLDAGAAAGKTSLRKDSAL
jgi:hypothetical protein